MDEEPLAIGLDVGVDDGLVVGVDEGLVVGLPDGCDVVCLDGCIDGFDVDATVSIFHF